MKRSIAHFCALFVAGVLSVMGVSAFGQPPPVPNDCWYAHSDDPEAYEDCLERELARTQALIRLAACELPYVSHLCTAGSAVGAAQSCPSGQVWHNGGCITPPPCPSGHQHNANMVCVPINPSPTNPHNSPGNSECYPGSQIPGCYNHDPAPNPNPPPSG